MHSDFVFAVAVYWLSRYQSPLESQLAGWSNP